jgi:hypothetical protein
MPPDCEGDLERAAATDGAWAIGAGLFDNSIWMMRAMRGHAALCFTLPF